MMISTTVSRTAGLVATALTLAASTPILIGAQQSPAGRLVSPCPGCGFPPEAIDHTSTTGWTQIFDGKTLDQWDGNPAVWRAENGTITAESTAERRVGSTFIIWRGGDVADFELKLEIKADKDIHSGVFYRGTVGPSPQRPATPARGGGGATPNRPPQPAFAVPADVKWNVTGYSLDFDYDADNDGNVQDTGGRTEMQIGWRGHIVRMEAGKRSQSIGSLGDRTVLAQLIKPGEWNQLHIIARGSQLTHIVNGQVMAMLIDDDPVFRKTKGVIALQIEQYGTGRINFRNIWVKQ